MSEGGSIAGLPPEPAFSTPADAQELVAALRAATAATCVLAGGTDLVLSLRRGDRTPDTIIDLSGVSELAGVSLADSQVHVGAMTTLTALAGDPVVLAHAACLAQAAGEVGSVQIRNVATVGGNVANASPCGDTIPALLALDAQVGTLDAAGRRLTRPLSDVVVGYERTSLAHDEVITELVFPAASPVARSAFAKVGSRTAVTIARLSIAVVVEHDAGSGRLSRPRVALGALGETAFRAPDLERVLDGRSADEQTRQAFAEACTLAVDRAIPGRYSQAYKREAAVGLADDVWQALWWGAA